MAQTGKQTNLLYGSVTPGAVPAADRLTTNAGGVEIALNAADGKLFFKDTAGIVRLIADVNAVAGGGNANITGGVINGVNIGSTVPGSGKFTTLTTQTIKVPLTGILKSNPVTGVATAVAGVDYLEVDTLGQPDGIATLGGDGKVPAGQLPATMVNGMHYLGLWDAQNGVPPIQDGVGEVGQFYKVRTAGGTELDGESTWFVGDSVVFNGTKWERISEGAPSVTSVNGMAGDVTINRSSLGAAAAGVNNDITQLAALSTNILVSQGGTGTSSLSGILKGDGDNPIQSAIPGIDYQVPTTGMFSQLLASDGNGGTINLNLGAGLSIVGNTISSSGGGGGPSTGGTVTSVNVSGNSTGLTFTGGPITHSGTLMLGGVLSVANGGTGKNTLSGILKGNGTLGLTSAVMGTDYAGPTTGTMGQVLASNGTGGFTNVTIGTGLNLSSGVLSATQGAVGGSVTSVQASGGNTGLTFAGGPITSSGILTLGGRLTVASGGTGVSTITGILKGNGSSPFSVAVAGTDFAAPPTGAATQLLANNGARGFANVTLGSGLVFSSGTLSVSTAQGGGTVTSVELVGGITGLKFLYPKVTTEGAITLDGTLGVANGGTGAGYIDGVVMGHGGGAMTAAVPGVDYAEAPRGPAGHLLSADGMGGFRYIRLGAGLSFNSRYELTTAGGTSDGSRSVKSYGALGDGVTDDAPFVKAALDDAALKGIAIFFPAGTYYLATPVTCGGKVTMVANNDVVISGSLRYYQAVFPPSAHTFNNLTPSAPFFRISGFDFKSSGNNYGLYVGSAPQTSFVSSFAMDNCRFYGNYGLQTDLLIGFEIDHCEFNTVAIGANLASCTNGTITRCRWQNHAFAGVHISKSVNDSTTTPRQGGENMKFNSCEWAVCTYAIYAEMHMWLVVDNSLMDYCGISVMLQGCDNAKFMNTYISASIVPLSTFAGTPYYSSPPYAGVALFAKPGGVVPGTIPSSVQAHNCEFVNYQIHCDLPIVWINGYENSTYPQGSTLNSFIDCMFLHPGGGLATGHSAPTILRIQSALSVRVAFCRFRSPNLSTTMTSAWDAPATAEAVGFGNQYALCQQSNVQVKSALDINPSQVYVQSADPGNVPPGTIWVTP